MLRAIIQVLRSVKRAYRRLAMLSPLRLRREIDTLYRLLHKMSHDLDCALDLSAVRTEQAFARQWETLKEGKYLLSDPWFRDNVARILAEEEIQIKPEWFRGKRVLDAGSGNGRWSYGFAQLGAHVTAVDVNAVAVEETRRALAGFSLPREFEVSSLEDLSRKLPSRDYDLVFCWGVLHHCRSFTKSLDELVKVVAPSGMLYLYLYGRESLTYSDDVEVFKERLRYHSLPTAAEQYAFLLQKARGDVQAVHNYHDIYAPLVNRRLEFAQVESMLKSRGFEDVVRTIEHGDLFIRAIRGNAKEYYAHWILPRKRPPYWFQHHESQ